MLTKTERLILSNQLQIMKALNLGDSDYYDEKINILQRGYACFYDEVTAMVSEDIPFETSREVFDILRMYRALNLSFLDLSRGEQRKIDERMLGFAGFSRDEEFQHYSFAAFLIDERGLFEEFRNESGYDSDLPQLPNYRKMLKQWAELGYRTALGPAEIRGLLQICVSIIEN